MLEPPFLDLHAAAWTGPETYEISQDARRFETWETNYAARLGLGAAVDYALGVGLQPAWARIQHLADTLRTALGETAGIDVQDKGDVRSGIVTFTSRALHATDVRAALASHDINVSVSPPEYAQYDLPHRGLPALVRASVHYYNTEQEIERFVATLAASSPRVR